MSLSESMIRGLATAQSFERGEDYYHSGAVLDLSKRGNTLLAHVEGSSYEPYEVTVDSVKGGVPLKNRIGRFAGKTLSSSDAELSPIMRFIHWLVTLISIWFFPGFNLPVTSTL